MKPFSISLIRRGKIVRWRGADRVNVGDVIHDLVYSDTKFDRVEVEEVGPAVVRAGAKLQAYLDRGWT